MKRESHCEIRQVSCDEKHVQSKWFGVHLTRSGSGATLVIHRTSSSITGDGVAMEFCSLEVERSHCEVTSTSPGRDQPEDIK